MLATCASGFGAVALQALLHDAAYGASGNHGTHFPAHAKNVIFLYMDGGPSQVDTFDPKPALTKYDGQDPGQYFKVQPTQFNNNGKVLKSPWEFKQHGQSGIPVSSLFPHVAKCVDDLAVVRSMVSEFPEHTFANYFLHTGSGIQGRPSMGAWINYGLGSENHKPPRLRRRQRRPHSPRRSRLLRQRLPPRQLSRLRLQTLRLRRRQHQPQ
jgi:hypothetical protein